MVTTSDTPPWRTPKGSPAVLGPTSVSAMTTTVNINKDYTTSNPSQSPVSTLADTDLEAPPGKWRKCETLNRDPYHGNKLGSSMGEFTAVAVNPPYDAIPLGTPRRIHPMGSQLYPPPTAPWRKSEGGTGLPAAKPRSSPCNPGSSTDHFTKSSSSTALPVSVPRVLNGNVEQPWNKLNVKCGLYPSLPQVTLPMHGTVLILSSGPSSNPANLQHSLRSLNLKVEA